MTDSPSHVPFARRPAASALIASMALASCFHCAFVRFLVTSADFVLKSGTRLYHCLGYHASKIVFANSGV